MQKGSLWSEEMTKAIMISHDIMNFKKKTSRWINKAVPSKNHTLSSIAPMARWFHEPVESFLKCAAGQMPLVARGTQCLPGQSEHGTCFRPRNMEKRLIDSVAAWRD